MRCDVLIVEDDGDLRELMAETLAIEGVRIATATNGREALAYLRTGEAPSLILLDLMMPVMDGWQFQREKLLDPRLAHVPVVVLSAVDEWLAAAPMPQLFLKKPLDFDRLVEIVRRYCRLP
jgi:CheY-like chemotaxis protein